MKADGGVWSAAPTPFTDDWKLDGESIYRLMEHQLKLGIKGVFIGGTSGEGPWLTQSMLCDLARRTAKAASGRMPVVVQVTDNSAERMIDNISRIADSGVDMAIIAPPFFQINATQPYLRDLYLKVIDNSPLPVGLYHRGKHSSVVLSGESIAEIARHGKVVMIKDSSNDTASKEAFLQLKRSLKDRELTLLNGNEFDCISHLLDGYDGLLLGGACFNGGMARRIYELTRAGKVDEARNLQERMNKLMCEVFGGEGFPCWLGGQKRMLVEMGVFSTSNTIINYQASDDCVKAIKAAFQLHKPELLPYQS